MARTKAAWVALRLAVVVIGSDSHLVVFRTGAYVDGASPGRLQPGRKNRNAAQ